MERRICPNCKDVLGEYDFFYCSSCGKKLPKELIREPKPIRVRTYTTPQVEDKLSFTVLKDLVKNKTFLSIAGLVVFIALVTFGISSTGIIELISFNISKGAGTSTPEINIPSRQQNTLTLNQDLQEGSFDENNFTQYIPSDVEFYFEGFDVVSLSSYLSKNENLKTFFTKSDLLLEDSFAGYFSNNPEGTWVYIFIPTDVEIVEVLLEGVEDEYWSFEIIDGKLFMASNEEAFDRTGQVISKLEPSLALNSDFVAKVQRLPNEGQVRVVFLSEGAKEIVRNSLGGLDQEIIGNINTILSSEYEEVVIN